MTGEIVKPSTGAGEDPAEDLPGFSRKMTQDEINALPLVSCPLPIYLVNDVAGLEKAVANLREERILGFDTETRPAFRKGESYLPSVLQLAGEREAYVIQLKGISFPGILAEFLEDAEIIKAGVALSRDVLDLKKLGEFHSRGFVDLSSIATLAGLKNCGLRGLSSVLLGFRIGKQAQRSDWSRRNLSEAQIRYAATDAWVGREIYLHMHDRGFVDLLLKQAGNVPGHKKADRPRDAKSTRPARD